MRRPLAWLDARIRLTELADSLLHRKVPGGLTWSHTLGSATLAVFLVQLVTGMVLAMYYAPSPDHAYDSILYIQNAVAGGALVRGIHHYGSSAMVILVGAHLLRVLMMGAYKYPREANWLIGVALLLLVLAFGFTGYLLPWDQKAYWATQVGTSMAGTTPLVGDMLVRLLRGGAEIGAATLTRFYALHVVLLPLLLGGFAMAHLVLVIRQGIAPRAKALQEGAPRRTDDPGYPAYYAAREASAKAGDVRFWPDVIAKDVVVATAVIVILVGLAWVRGAGLEGPADPTEAAYLPRPEWYFLPLFQLLKLVPGSLESLVAVGIPAAILLGLVALPFLDRRSTRSIIRRPLMAFGVVAVMGSLGLLLGSALSEESDVPDVSLSGRPLSGVERAGYALFKRQQCGSCHAVGDTRPEEGEDVPDAPDLTEIGLEHSAAWLHSFLEEPLRFHPESEMPSYGPPVLTHQEIEELVRYLVTLRGPDGENRTPEFHDTFPPPPTP